MRGHISTGRLARVKCQETRIEESKGGEDGKREESEHTHRCLSEYVRGESNEVSVEFGSKIANIGPIESLNYVKFLSQSASERLISSTCSKKIKCTLV